MDPPNVLWFFGAFAIEVAAYELIQTIPDNQRGVWVFLEAFGRRREAFWFHALGLFSVAVGLIFFAVDPSGDHERGWIPMLIGGVLLLIAAGPVRRATWAVYGVLGLYSPVVHYLIKDLNQSRWPFALLLLAL